MDAHTVSDVLQHHGIKPTANRVAVLRLLTRTHHPVSLKDLESEIPSLDKSSIFRVLTLLREHHAVHVIDGGDGVSRYELCHSSNTDGTHDDDEHVHFFCERCHRTLCLHDVPVPSVPVPPDYRPTSVSVLVKGICDVCLSRQGSVTS